MVALDQAPLTEGMEIYLPSEAKEPLSNFKRKSLKNGSSNSGILLDI